MREILFRGKRTDNGKWVEGYFWRGVDHIYMIPSHVRIGYDDKTKYMSAYAVEVGPETLCQYTGLTDKNGKRIWENDIVRIENSMDEGAGNIEFYDGIWYVDGEPSNSLHDIIEYDDGEVEVIGNIFDNHELLKEVS